MKSPILLILALLSSPAFGDPLKVEAKPFAVHIEVTGTMVPDSVTEIALHPKVVSSYTIASVVAHGTTVKKGDVLVSFEQDRLKAQLRKQELALKNAQVELKAAENGLKYAKLSKDTRLRTSAYQLKLAQENVKRFEEALGPSNKRFSQFRLTQLKQRLLYAEEEMKQLQKMYKEDQITEETEEIVLTRQRNYVDALKFVLSESKLLHGQTMTYEIPRQGRSLQDALAKARLDDEKLRIDLPAEISSKTIAVEKRMMAVFKVQETLENYKHDASLLEVVAGADGVVYYGRFKNGRWSPDEAIRTLKNGGSVRPHQVIMTIVSPKSSKLHLKVSEEQAGLLRIGQKVRLIPHSNPTKHRAGLISAITSYPVASNQYDATVQLKAAESTLSPGMQCNAVIVPYSQPEVIAIPKRLVQVDYVNGSRHFVWVMDGKKPVKRYVQVGYLSGDDHEIRSGLKIGDLLKN